MNTQENNREKQLKLPPLWPSLLFGIVMATGMMIGILSGPDNRTQTTSWTGTLHQQTRVTAEFESKLAKWCSTRKSTLTKLQSGDMVCVGEDRNLLLPPDINGLTGADHQTEDRHHD